MLVKDVMTAEGVEIEVYKRKEITGDCIYSHYMNGEICYRTTDAVLSSNEFNRIVKRFGGVVEDEN